MCIGRVFTYVPQEMEQNGLFALEGCILDPSREHLKRGSNTKVIGTFHVRVHLGGRNALNTSLVLLLITEFNVSNTIRFKSLGSSKFKYIARILCT